ncbi:MAG: hypothetical protein HY666_00730 [Chloroflexi bacterium]|nr:hypothetical protein [Chloroflexota bacterium]
MNADMHKQITGTRVVKKAKLIEKVGNPIHPVSRYKLSEPWDGLSFVVVFHHTTVDGEQETVIAGAKESGPIIQEGLPDSPRFLARIGGWCEDPSALRKFGWEITQ